MGQFIELSAIIKNSGLPVYHYYSVLPNQELIAQENLESPSNDCSAIAFHPSSNYLATGYTDGRIILESLKSKKTIFSDFIHRSKVESIVFTSDGKRIISGGEDRTVSIINLEELEQL